MKLPFKSSQAFFDYCNEHFPENPERWKARPALVPEPGFMGISSHVSRTDDGRFRVSLLVCARPRGFFLIADTAKPGGEPIHHGDVLMWMPFKAPPLFGKGIVGRATGDKRSSWVGFIVGKIAPEIDQAGKFTVICEYPWGKDS